MLEVLLIILLVRNEYRKFFIEYFQSGKLLYNWYHSGFLVLLKYC